MKEKNASHRFFSSKFISAFRERVESPGPVFVPFGHCGLFVHPKEDIQTYIGNTTCLIQFVPIIQLV
jgi:hypothetical protein